MPSPFPGMDPYLEHPELWPGVHHRLIVAIADLLSLQLRPKYSVSLEVRMYQTTASESLVVGIPDVAVLSKSRQTSSSSSISSQVAIAPRTTEPITVTLPVPITVRQGYLEIEEVTTKEVVTSIELLSPVNKRSGKEREAYLKKRQRILGTFRNFVEIDLLRSESPMPILNQSIESDYRILVSRGETRPKADLYAFNLANQIPSFSLPLRDKDPETVIDLQSLLTGIYDIGGYDLKIDYSQDPVPSLSENDAAWANALLLQQGFRE